MKCDELKWKWAYFPYLDAPEKQNESAVNAGYVKVVLKSEADKAIAGLKQKLNEAQTELELWRDGSIISESHQKEINEKRHSDYKRCVAIAGKCRLRARWFGDNAFYKKEQWALKWHRRWMELAEKFKPNNEVNNG